MVLTNIYYPPQSKNSISLRGWRRNKTFPGSAFGSSLCTSQNQRNPSFSWPAIPLETELQPQGGSKGIPCIPWNLEKVQNYPKSVKRATLFRENPVILLQQVSGGTLNNLRYILSDLQKAVISTQIKEKSKFWYRHSSIYAVNEGTHKKPQKEKTTQQ